MWYQVGSLYLASVSSHVDLDRGLSRAFLKQARQLDVPPGFLLLQSGILAANAESPSFQEVFFQLVEIARKPALFSETDGSNLPQVHSLNCIRDVFRSSLLMQEGRGLSS